MTNVENCNRCPNTLQRGRVERYKNDELLEVICNACYAKDHLQTYHETRRLSSTLIANAINGQTYSTEDSVRILAEEEVVEEAIEEFENEVWWKGGLQVWNKQSRDRGFSVKQDDIEARMYTLAGRTMITIVNQAKGIDVTVITSEDDERDFLRENGMNETSMGLQSIHATAREAVELLADVRRLQNQGLFHFQPDNQVSLF